jgi:hypothetical protein
MILLLLLAATTSFGADSRLLKGIFVGDADLPEPPVNEKVMLYDGPLPEGRDPSFWTLYEKEWFKHVSEKDVFHAFLRSKDWEIGIGRGGQLYSWRGPWGEALPPQAAPWMDEVWQSTLHSPHVQNILNAIYEHDEKQSNSRNSIGQAFVHGSGSSNKYGALGDDPHKMFYCPMLARWYDEKNKSLSLINWGQSSTQPTIFPHQILFYTRYRYMGEGVLEVVNVIYNFGTYDYGYNGTPWGGVRATTFPEMYWSNVDGNVRFNEKLIGFGSEGSYQAPPRTDGWLGTVKKKGEPKSHAFGFVFGRSASSVAMGSAGAGPPRDYTVMASNAGAQGSKLGTGQSFWVRYYLAVGSFEDVVRNSKLYAKKAGWGDMNIPEKRASLQTLYGRKLEDGRMILSRERGEGSKPVCRVWNEPVLHSMPLFSIRELPEGRTVITTDPYALSRKEPYLNPLPKGHALHKELEGAVRRFTYESENGKQLEWHLLGFVMPTDKAGGDRSAYVDLAAMVGSPRTRGMLALKYGASE